MFEKKINYENIFEWSNSNQGTCFYCKQDKPVHIKLVGEKGICNDCFKEFRIANVAADRHVIQAITPKFHSEHEAVEWFEKNGAVLKLVDNVDDTNIYHAIADMEKYNKYMEISRKASMSGMPIMMDEETMDCFMAFNNVEISKDGSYHIVY